MSTELPETPPSYYLARAKVKDLVNAGVIALTTVNQSDRLNYSASSLKPEIVVVDVVGPIDESHTMSRVLRLAICLLRSEKIIVMDYMGSRDDGLCQGYQEPATCLSDAHTRLIVVRQDQPIPEGLASDIIDHRPYCELQTHRYVSLIDQLVKA